MSFKQRNKRSPKKATSVQREDEMRKVPSAKRLTRLGLSAAMSRRANSLALTLIVDCKEVGELALVFVFLFALE